MKKQERPEQGYSARMYEHFLYAALAKASKSVKSATGKDHSRQRLEALTRVVEEIVDLEWLVQTDVVKLCTAYYAHHRETKEQSKPFKFAVDPEIVRVAMGKLDEYLEESEESSATGNWSAASPIIAA
eukprot:CAMPEP_0170176946 /NCGR_PEP_ID=MMETSP0040_2-20121228/9698_1 /TAXON_ID=641309 /ORGANISM="Lotharella oceanica, Strain CCMP622" /LENGTH=127 /DNA_ID=CAMNT_0010419417 /DNA_START=89 /DNA_END=472 /DNA_ORIENTATION=+